MGSFTYGDEAVQDARLLQARNHAAHRTPRRKGRGVHDGERGSVALAWPRDLVGRRVQGEQRRGAQDGLKLPVFVDMHHSRPSHLRIRIN